MVQTQQQLDAKQAEVELAAAEPLQAGGDNDDDGSDGDHCDGESSSTTSGDDGSADEDGSENESVPISRMSVD
eukprot:COSAG01_NODE_634_length_14664_cov_22.808376_1_plen_73_part_00